MSTSTGSQCRHCHATLIDNGRGPLVDTNGRWECPDANGAGAGPQHNLHNPAN